MTLKAAELSQETMMILVVVFAVTVILSIAVTLYAKSVDKSGSIESCRLNVIMAAKAKTGGETIATYCPRSTLNLELKDAQANGKLNEDLLKKKIADEMKICWDKMSGDSQLNPYAETKTPFAKENICLVCTEIKFSAELQQKLPQINGFDAFLASQSYAAEFMKTIHVTGKHMPFWFYEKDVQTGVLKESNIINTKNAYYVIYATMSPNYYSSDSMMFRAARGVFGDWMQKIDSYSVMYLIPPDQIASLQCSSLKG